MGPDPAPKWADPVALRASPQPSCLHTTRASVQVPAVITDGAPGALVKDLHSPGAGTAPVHQAELSAVWGKRNGTMGHWRVVRGRGGRGWEGSSVLWDPHLSSRGRSLLRPQSLLVQIESLHWGSTWVWFPAETAMIRRLGGLKNRKLN